MRIPRRQVLRLPAVVAVVAAAGCTLGDETPPPPDPLIALSEQARLDAFIAGRAEMQDPEHAARFQRIADERAAHAQALETEVRRLADPDSPPSTAPSGPSAITNLASLRASLTQSARDAASAARVAEGYRAGLLASISAACAVHLEVLLA